MYRFFVLVLLFPSLCLADSHETIDVPGLGTLEVTRAEGVEFKVTAPPDMGCLGFDYYRWRKLTISPYSFLEVLDAYEAAGDDDGISAMALLSLATYAVAPQMIEGAILCPSYCEAQSCEQHPASAPIAKTKDTNYSRYNESGWRCLCDTYLPGHDDPTGGSGGSDGTDGQGDGDDDGNTPDPEDIT
ncbi:MAG: hypothetical protein KDD66_17255 [Bdellovibrionales bacterium]|nr:hypothetical protein [Bdellovibrionales bacterium]